MEESQYIGVDKVKSVALEEQKTPSGADVLRVTFETEHVSDMILPRKTFDFLVSAQPVEPTELRRRRYEPLLNELATVILEHNVQFEDMAYVGKSLVNKLEDAFERAASFLWKRQDTAWVSGIDHRAGLSILDAERILKEIAK